MRPSSPYFVSAPVDALFIGGLSIATALAFWGLESAGRPLPGPALAFGLAWVVNWPHFSASSYRLYHRRSNVAQYPVTAIAVPLVILAGVVGALLSPTTAGSALVKLYLLWSPFHFSGQSRGITQIYARRQGLTLTRMDRAILTAFFAASYFRLIFGQESGTGIEFLGGVAYPLFGVPRGLGAAVRVLEAVFGAGLLFVYARHAVALRRLPSAILLLPALTQVVWFEAGSRMPAYGVLIPFFHSLQYLLIAWAMQLRERREVGALAPDGRGVLRETTRWGVLNLVGGALLFWALPEATRALGVPRAAAAPVLFAAVQIHHFFVDGVIWKLRNPKVSTPLLVDLRDRDPLGAVSGGAA